MPATLHPPSPRATQQSLDVRDTRFSACVCIRGAKNLLILREDEVLALIQNGDLSHAWDIGLSDDRREVRILRRSIDRYKELSRKMRDNFPLEDAEAAKLLLPPGHKQPFLTTPQIEMSLNCVSTHVLNLIDAKQLRLQPGTDYGRGPTGAALVTVESFNRFLAKRRISQ